MRFAPPPLAAAATMSSSRFNPRGRSSSRGFCDRPPSDAWNPPRHPFRPQHFRPPRPADFRNWRYSLSQPPPHCERFVVLSYNILADYLARDHQSKLYYHIPHHILDWEWRKRRLLIEFGLWDPDIMCLQEVDKFHDLEAELTVRGYTGIWKMRTGNAIDGCAIFWRTTRFHLRHEEHIEFNKLGLRDNVAQICVLESRTQTPVENASARLAASSDRSRGANQVVICNIHVLYNPKRGEIKLGQVRILLDRAYAVSRTWNDAPVIVCGDFNSTPKSPLYNFISSQTLSLSGLTRDQISGQYSATYHASRPYVESGLYRGQPSLSNSSDVAIGIKQGTLMMSHGHYKPQNDMENAYLTEKQSIPQRLNAMLDISARSSLGSQYIVWNDTVSDENSEEKGALPITDDLRSESSSLHCRFVNQSKVKFESCREWGVVPVSIGRAGKELTPAVSRSSDPCIEQQDRGGNSNVCQINQSEQNTLHELNEQGFQSSPNISNGSVTIPTPGSFSGIHESSLKVTDYSGELKDSSNFFMEVADVSTEPENYTACKVHNENVSTNWNQKFRGSSEGLSSNIASKEALVDEFAFDKLTNCADVDFSSSKIVLGSFPASIETPIIQGTGSPSIRWTSEQKCDLVSSKIVHERSQSEFSAGSTSSLNMKVGYSSLSEMGKIIAEDVSSDVDHGAVISLPGAHPCVKGTVTSHDTNYSSKVIEPDSEEGSQSPKNAASSSWLHRELSQDLVGVGQDASVIDGLCSLTENSDPDFFKELLGTEGPSEFREEVVPMKSSIQIHSSSLSMHVAPSSGSYLSSVEFREDSSAPTDRRTFDQEKYSYNPYLWTPMEIEVASGSAECTFIKHALKLRSVYADLKDTGAKDSSREPDVTSYHRQFMGTVDYIWCSEGLETIKALDTIPKHVLQRTPGFPTHKWGSDHISLVCQLAFTNGFPAK